MAQPQLQPTQKLVDLSYVDGFSKCMELLVNFMENHLQKSCDVEDALPQGIYGAAGSLKSAVEQLQREIRHAEGTKFGPVKPSKPDMGPRLDTVEITIQEEQFVNVEIEEQHLGPVSVQSSGEDDVDEEDSEKRAADLQLQMTGPRHSRVSAFGRHPVSIDDLQGVPARMPVGIINPGNTKKLAWDFFVMFCVLSDAVVLPFQLAFKNQSGPDTFDNFWFFLTTSVFSIDIILSFNTALDKGDNMTGTADLIKDRPGIARRYVRGWFLSDFVSTIPWGSLEAILGGGGGSSSQATKLLKVVKFLRIMRLMRMLRLAKLKTIWENIETYLGSVVLVQSVMLVRILFVVIAICHWNACIFWVVGSPQSFVTDLLAEESQKEFFDLPHWTTIMRSGPLNQPTWRYFDRSTTENYIFCFYWTLGVMRTMPAEVTPVNLTERVFVLTFMFFALSAFAISVGSLTQAYFKISERGRNYNDEMFAVRMHLKKLKVSDTAQRRIKNYLCHLFERRRIMAKETNLLGCLPASLAQEVQRAKIFQYLQRLPAIAGLRKSAIEEICQHSKLCDCLPGEAVCYANQVADAAWVICAGRVQVEDDMGAVVPLDHPMDIINMDCLSTADDTLCTFTVLAVTCVETLKVDKQVFIKFAMQDSLLSTANDVIHREVVPLEVVAMAAPPGDPDISATNAAIMSSS